MMRTMPELLLDHSLLALFLLSFCASTLLPLGSEWLLVVLLLEGSNPLTAVGLILTQPGSIAATLPQYCEASAELIRYDLDLGNFEFRFVIVPLWDAGSGELVAFYRPGPDSTPRHEESLWSGDVRKGDTISVLYRIVVQSEGRHEVAASVRLADESILSVRSLGGARLLFEVRNGDLVTSTLGWLDIMAQRLRQGVADAQPELSHLGIYSTNLDTIRMRAPGIMQRLEEEAGYYDDSAPRNSGKSRSRTPVQDRRVSFEVNPDNATLFLFQEWHFEFRAVNNSDTDFRNKYLQLNDQCITYTIRDMHGKEYPGVRMTAEIWLNEESILHPGDSSFGSGSVLHDTWGPDGYVANGLAYLPVGEYIVEFRWAFSPEVWPEGTSPFAFDTAHVTVAMPHGTDSLAMERYCVLNAAYDDAKGEGSTQAERRRAMADRASAYVSLYRDYPASTFGGMALQGAVGYMDFKSLEEIAGAKFSDLVREYAFRYPNRQSAQGYLRSLARASFCSHYDRLDVLHDVADSLKNFEVGRLARRLISDPRDGLR